MKKKIALIVAGIIFSLVALIHLLRLIWGFEITFAEHVIPMWPSLVAFVITLLLAIWMFIASKE